MFLLDAHLILNVYYYETMTKVQDPLEIHLTTSCEFPQIENPCSTPEHVSRA